MQVLPAGYAVPPAPHLAGMALALAAVAWGLRERRPAFGAREVLALVPWMLLGAGLNVFHQIGALPRAVAPLFGTPGVYLSVAAAGGGTWLLADAASSRPARALAAAGTAGFLAVAAALGGVGLARGTLRVGPSLAALVAAVPVALAVWAGLRRLRPGVAATGRAGALAVFAHALDALSTAVGVDWLGFGERTPLSRLIIEFAAGLPTAELLGAGWLFVLVKVTLVAWIVTLFADYVRADPAEGYALLGLVIAVGLGPGVHNLLLFAVA